MFTMGSVTHSLEVEDLCSCFCLLSGRSCSTNSALCVCVCLYLQQRGTTLVPLVRSMLLRPLGLQVIRLQSFPPQFCSIWFFYPTFALMLPSSSFFYLAPIFVFRYHFSPASFRLCRPFPPFAHLHFPHRALNAHCPSGDCRGLGFSKRARQGI